MRKFMSQLQMHGENAYHPDEYAKRVGRESYDALRALGVLVDAPPARMLPCGMYLEDCTREIFESETKPGVFVTECGRECDPDDYVDTCEATELTAADVARVRASLDALLRLVAAARGLREADVHRVEGSPSFWPLGRGDDGRVVIFCASPYARGFEMLLLAQREPTLVLVPSRERVPGMITQRYATGDRVEVRFLEDELVLRGQGISFVSLRTTIAAVGTRVLLDRDGERRISDAEYEQLRTADVDLVLDFTATTPTGGVPVRIRDLDGQVREVWLPRTQAHALLELMRTPGRELRPAELKCMREAQARDPGRLIENMRQEVDVKLARYGWRSIHTIKGATPGAKAYAFRPPPELRYAVLLAA